MHMRSIYLALMFLWHHATHYAHVCLWQEARTAEVIAKIQQPYQSILLWLLDLCVLVTQHKSENKVR